MKKILQFLLVFITVLTITQKLNAQCSLTLNNLQIQVVGAPVDLGGGKIKVVFNAQFDISVNSGFKVLYFHSWLAADYPATPIFNCSSSSAQDPGTATQLGTVVDQVGKSFLDIGFTNVPTTGALNVVQPLVFSTSFVHDATVVLTKPLNSPGLTGSKFFNGTADHYTLNNVTVIMNASLASTIVVKTDIWGSNSNAPDPKAQCYLCAQTQFFNDPTVTGFKNCNNPRQYSIGISTIDPVVKTITYKVYLDVNGNGILDGLDQLAFTSGNIQISAPGGVSPDNYSSGLVSVNAPYHNTQPWSDYEYLILVEGASLSNSILKALDPANCFPLPVNLKTFNVNRNKSTVSLVWETSSESNNKGFEVQRKIGANEFTTIGFVNTKAAEGNSQTDLFYSFTDLNATKGVSQYRLQQIDFDGKAKLSDIRSVKGDGQSAKTIIYPNPSSNGTVNVVFEDSRSIRDIQLMDMNGRVVNQWRNLTNNNFKIDNLVPGFYNLRVVDQGTKEQSIEKIIIR